MDSTLSAAIVVAYDFVPSADVGDLVRRLHTETIGTLRFAARLPPRPVRYVLASDDRELHAAPAANVGGRCGTIPWRAMLARVGDPTLAVALYTADPALDDNEATRAAVWAAADPADAGWLAPGGLVELLTRTAPPVAPSLLRPALRAPFPDAVITALVTLAPSMTPRHVTRVAATCSTSGADPLSRRRSPGCRRRANCISRICSACCATPSTHPRPRGS